MIFPHRILLLSLVGMVLFTAGCGSPGRPAPRRYTILATGFMRGQIDDYERRSGMGHARARYFGGAGRTNTLLALRKRHWAQRGHRVVTVDLGDFLSGSPEATATEGGTSVAVLASRGYDAVALGNREFTFGQRRLHQLNSKNVTVNGMHQQHRRLPLVSSNVTLTNPATALFGVGEPAPKTPTPPDFAVAAVEPPAELAGERLRILAFTPGDTASVIDPKKLRGLTIESSLARTVARHAPKASEADGEFTVLLCQDDVIAKRESLATAAGGSGVDLVIGHAYGRGAGPFQVDGTWFTGVRNDLLGSVVVELHCRVDPLTGRILSLEQGYHVTKGRKPGRDYLKVDKGPIQGEPIDLSAPIPPQRNLVEAFSPWKQALNELETRLTESEVDLFGAYEEESNLGNLVADALRSRAQAQVSLISAGVVGHERIRAGAIRRRNLSQMYPYKNELVRLRIGGETLRAALEGMVDREVRVLTSGLHYRYFPRSRRLGPVSIGGQSLDDDKTYTVAMNKFAYQRDPVLGELDAEELGDCQEHLAAYLSAQTTVKAAVEGRVVRSE